MTAVERFAALSENFRDRPGVTLPTGRAQFGGSALKVDGKIFAMLHQDHLVVKLSADRVAGLIAAGVGSAFDSGRGSPMRQWLVIADEEMWSSLAEEAYAATLTRPSQGVSVDPP